ncbi:hypothetical protein PTSG_06471 [Salpingoeca rosetta]|uniref:protein S-acyltransferase n=1 Tax=Salpingoeca rosetta (strain ATCC 50818 / BSB-021) TaxID=946362 RepID=F2UFW6_SALR5|nr:uncharacterized protein PTSG_06471 [Salpingoeca rosetta]EGD75394.1 hypothetical protein PTSG_06471 [Salpingoeca rosetta]|eukprot:XP_004991851.1 hypothetical protein PTSG_06471 [Salpingoeca rosetta]
MNATAVSSSSGSSSGGGGGGIGGSRKGTSKASSSAPSVSGTGNGSSSSTKRQASRGAGAHGNVHDDGEVKASHSAVVVMPEQEHAHPKVYEVYTGKSKLWCGGRCITGDNYGAIIFSWIMILLASTLFFVFTAPFLWRDLSPAVVIICAYLLYTVVANLLWAGLTDPGICPRALREEGDNIIRLPHTKPNTRPPPRQRTAMINGQEVQMRYCFTCHQYRMPRDTHCGVTDDCVDTVGKGLAKHPGVPVVVFITFVTFFPISGLVTFHVALVRSAVSTNESLKLRFDNVESPYHRGHPFKNAVYTLFGPLRPPLMRWRELASLYDLMHQHREPRRKQRRRR